VVVPARPRPVARLPVVRGRPGDSFLLLVNADGDPVEFEFPERLGALDARVVLDTAVLGTGTAAGTGPVVADCYRMAAHSAAVLRVTRPAT
jgi:hypothetical protein